MKKNYFFQVLTVVLVLMFISSSSFSSGLDEQIEKVTINWGKKIVQAKGTGLGKTLACRVAKTDAYRNLAGAIYGIKVTSEKTIDDLGNENTEVKSQISGLIDGGQFISEKENSEGNGSCEVILEIKLTGEESIAQLLTTTIANKEKSILKDKKINIISLPSPPAKPAVGSYSSLIIDATKSKVQPVIHPKIIAEDGNIIYSIFNLNIDSAVKKGIVDYTDSLENAKKSTRAGSKPLIINAISSAGTYSGDIIVTAKDANSILKLNEKSGFLQNLKVIVII